MNQLSLRAQVLELEAVRFTPAGVPVVNCTLQHRGEVLEAGAPRLVEMALPAVAIGVVSGQVAAHGLGFEAVFTGFLAPRRRNAKTLVFHITALQG